MISIAVRTRILVSVLAALALGVGSLFLIFYEPCLQPLPSHEPQTTGGPGPRIETAPDSETQVKPWFSSAPRVIGAGPRGLDLGQGQNDDNLHESVIENLGTFPAGLL
jgi:hypothetical protein